MKLIQKVLLSDSFKVLTDFIRSIKLKYTKFNNIKVYQKYFP